MNGWKVNTNTRTIYLFRYFWFLHLLSCLSFPIFFHLSIIYFKKSWSYFLLTLPYERNIPQFKIIDCGKCFFCYYCEGIVPPLLDLTYHKLINLKQFEKWVNRKQNYNGFIGQ